MRTYFSFNFSWTRGAPSSALLSKASGISDRGLWRARGSHMDGIILLLLLLAFLIILSK